MKILITGSFCSGKTTLALGLFEELKNSALVQEVTREVLRLFGRVDWSIPELRDYIFIRQLIEEKTASQASTSHIIVDAGIVSLIAHDRLLSNGQPDRLRLLKYFRHLNYDLVFFCDHKEIPMVDDGERFTDELLRDTLSTITQETLVSLGICNYVRITGSRSERLASATKRILEGV